MRRVDFESNRADVKRIALARRFEEFGLNDPLGDARLRGFSLDHYHHGSFGVLFKNRRVALCDFSERNTPHLRVEDVVPQDADAALRMIATRARDVARRIDSILKADKRELDAFRKTATIQDPDAAPPTLSAHDAFALCAASHRPDQRVVFKFSSYSMDILAVQFKSQNYPENNMTFRMHFENGQFSGHDIRLNPEFIADKLPEARAFIEPALHNLPSDTQNITFSDDVIEHWDDVIETQHQIKDFLIEIADSRISVKRQDVLILVLEKHIEYEDGGRTRGVRTFHPGLGPQVMNGCLGMVKEAIERSPRMTPPDMMGISEEDIGRMAARELSDVDFGYGM